MSHKGGSLNLNDLEVKDLLQLQAAITNELTDIIGGANAVS
jgi:F0F1-type ATP synthase gamma subunit